MGMGARGDTTQSNGEMRREEWSQGGGDGDWDGDGDGDGSKEEDYSRQGCNTKLWALSAAPMDNPPQSHMST